MAVGTRTRFEVFKRDGFICQYCGRQPPQVTLEADHVVPRVEGGGDEFENLITACKECNRGKAGVPLDVTAPMLDMEAQAEMIKERERQLRAYNAAKREQRERSQADFNAAWNYWFHVWGETSLQKWHCPRESMLNHYIDLLGVEEVKSAIDITRNRFNYLVADAPRYFGGVLKRKLAIVEGRLVPCTVCGEPLELTAEQASQGLLWSHGNCATIKEPGREPTERAIPDRVSELMNHPATAELIHRSIAIFQESWNDDAECAWIGYEREIKPRINTASDESGLHRDTLIRYCTGVKSCGCSSCLGDRVDD
jgi:HNH endonuclease